MKCTIQTLTTQLSRAIAPVYFLHGDDVYLREYARTQILAAAKKNGFSEHNRVSITPTFNWGRLAQDAASQSLFAEGEMLEYSLGKYKPGTAGAKAIKQYCKAPNLDKCLIFLSDRLPAAQQKTAWLSAINTIGIVVALYPLNPEQTRRWLLDKAHQEQIRLLPDAVSFLMSQYHGNLFAAVQTIETLALAYPNETISAEQLFSYTAPHTQYNLFELTPLLLRGDVASLLILLERFERQGTEPALLLWLLVQTIERALTLQQSDNLSETFSTLRIFDRDQQDYRQFMARHSDKHLRQALLYAQMIDAMMKGVVSADLWRELNNLTLILASSTVNHKVTHAHFRLAARHYRR